MTRLQFDQVAGVRHVCELSHFHKVLLRRAALCTNRKNTNGGFSKLTLCESLGLCERSSMSPRVIETEMRLYIKSALEEESGVQDGPHFCVVSQ